MTHVPEVTERLVCHRCGTGVDSGYLSSKGVVCSMCATMAKIKAQEVSSTKPRGSRNVGIGAVARRYIMQGMNFEQVRAEVLKIAPQSKFSKACYSWYKGKIAKAKGATS